MARPNDFDSIAWSVAEGRTEEYPYQIRFREFAADFPRERFPHRLNVFWTLAAPLENGLASKADLKEVHVFETRLAEAVEADGFGVMSMSLTGNGQRELVFHVPDPDEFVRRLSEMPQEEERYPIELHADEDAAWEYVDDVLEGVERE